MKQFIEQNKKASLIAASLLMAAIVGVGVYLVLSTVSPRPASTGNGSANMDGAKKPQPDDSKKTEPIRADDVLSPQELEAASKDKPTTPQVDVETQR